MNEPITIPLADWDKDNILRGEVGITHDPHDGTELRLLTLSIRRDASMCLRARSILNMPAMGLCTAFTVRKARG